MVTDAAAEVMSAAVAARVRRLGDFMVVFAWMFRVAWRESFLPRLGNKTRHSNRSNQHPSMVEMGKNG
jgi:hypothetical protein